MQLIADQSIDAEFFGNHRKRNKIDRDFKNFKLWSATLQDSKVCFFFFLAKTGFQSYANTIVNKCTTALEMSEL